MRFQKGDQQIVRDGELYGLRLTMGAMAEINSRLCAAGPGALSARLRRLSVADGRVLLACVMRPCLSEAVCADRVAARFSDRDIATALPIICSLFEQAFKDER